MIPVTILATGSYLPKRAVSNDELAERLTATSDEWIYSHTGIRQRRVAAEDETTADLAVHAARQALDRAGVDPKELGTILLATSTPDYAGLPSTACVIQDRLGAKNASAFDITAACSGFVYGLHVIRGMAQLDDRPMLVIGAEMMTRIMDWDDYKTCVLFGDGAGAAVVQAVKDVPDDSASSTGIVDSWILADGSGSQMLRRDSDTRCSQVRPDRSEVCRESIPRRALEMQGRAVFNFAVRAMSQVISHFLDRHDLTPDDIAYVVPHQANDRIIQAAVKRVAVPQEKFFVNVDRFANTSAASIPIALSEMEDRRLLRRGDLIITVGFGGGLTYGGNLIYW